MDKKNGTADTASGVGKNGVGNNNTNEENSTASAANTTSTTSAAGAANVISNTGAASGAAGAYRAEETDIGKDQNASGTNGANAGAKICYF